MRETMKTMRIEKQKAEARVAELNREISDVRRQLSDERMAKNDLSDRLRRSESERLSIVEILKGLTVPHPSGYGPPPWHMLYGRGPWR